jgi:hypothetical protein
MAEFRSRLCDRITQIHGIQRKKANTGAEPESQGAFIKRAAAELGKAVSFFQPLADEISATLVFDPSEKETSSRTPHVSKADLERARQLIDQGPDKLRISLGKIEALIGRSVPITGDRHADERTVASAVKDYRAAMAASLMA